MPDLKPSRSEPTAHRANPTTEFGRSQTNTSNQPRLSRVFSAQHLDDASIYQGADHNALYVEPEDEDESGTQKKVTERDYDEASDHAQEAGLGMRMENDEPKDLEANNLEKKPSVKSVKDPNLVRADQIRWDHGWTG